MTQTNSRAFDRDVPRGLQIAASWSWRVLLIVALALAVGWLLRYLSEVVIPVAVATLLAAMLFPVAKRLTAWGLPRAAAAAVSVLGGLTLILGALALIGTQIALQAPALSSNVVAGFNTLLTWLRDGPLPIDESWMSLDEWVPRIQEFLASSQSSIARWVQAIGSQVGHFLAGVAITLFAALLLPVRRAGHLDVPAPVLPAHRARGSTRLRWAAGRRCPPSSGPPSWSPWSTPSAC